MCTYVCTIHSANCIFGTANYKLLPNKAIKPKMDESKRTQDSNSNSKNIDRAIQVRIEKNKKRKKEGTTKNC